MVTAAEAENETASFSKSTLSFKSNDQGGDTYDDDMTNSLSEGYEYTDKGSDTNSTSSSGQYLSK